jgi:hypothetical protein
MLDEQQRIGDDQRESEGTGLKQIAEWVEFGRNGELWLLRGADG